MQRTALVLSAMAMVASSATAAAPPPRATPVLGWNAWNTFSTNGKPMRGGRKEYETGRDR